MENEITILEVREYKSIHSVTVIYVKNGKEGIVFGRTKEQAIENIAKVEKRLAENKNVEIVSLPKRSNSGRYFVNNNGFMVEE